MKFESFPSASPQESKETNNVENRPEELRVDSEEKDKIQESSNKTYSIKRLPWIGVTDKINPDKFGEVDPSLHDDLAKAYVRGGRDTMPQLIDNLDRLADGSLTDGVFANLEEYLDSPGRNEKIVENLDKFRGLRKSTAFKLIDKLDLFGAEAVIENIDSFKTVDKGPVLRKILEKRPNLFAHHIGEIEPGSLESYDVDVMFDKGVGDKALEHPEVFSRTGQAQLLDRVRKDNSSTGLGNLLKEHIRKFDNLPSYIVSNLKNEFPELTEDLDEMYSS